VVEALFRVKGPGYSFVVTPGGVTKTMTGRRVRDREELYIRFSWSSSSFFLWAPESFSGLGVGPAYVHVEKPEPGFSGAWKLLLNIIY